MSKYLTAEQINNAVALCKDEPFTKASIIAITELLPAADVVETVYCGECIHYIEPYCARFIMAMIPMNENDFCSKGERRDTNE